MSHFKSMSLALGLMALMQGQGFAQEFSAEITALPAGARTLSAGKVYQLVSRYSGKCLDVRDHSLADGGTLQQWNCTSKSNQKFLVRDAYKNAFNLIAQESQKAVRLSSEDSNDGTAIIQSGEYPGNVARFHFAPTANGGFQIINTHSGKCLDIAGPSHDAGANAQQWSCTGGANQEWFFVEQTEGLGEVKWDLRDSGLQADQAGRLFRQSSDGSVSRVNKQNGTDQWTHHTGGYAYIGHQCNDESRIYLTASNYLKALNVDSGQQEWKVELAGDSNIYHCVEGYNSIFSFSSANNGVMRSVEKATGRIRWEYSNGNFLSFIGKDAQNVYVSHFVGGKNRVIALESGTGRVRWTRDILPSEYFFTDLKGRLYVRANNGLQKVDFSHGGAAWSYFAAADEYVAVDVGADGSLYFRQGLTQKRINVDNGQVVWTHRFDGLSDAAYVSATVLKNGEVVLTATDSSNGAIILRKLRSHDGSIAWDKRLQETDGYVLQDRAGNLVLRIRNSLELLNPETGASLWRFRREFAEAGENLYAFETYGDDIYVTYGAVGGRFPPMGLLRLDAKTGALQWDKYLNETTSIIFADKDAVYASGVRNTHVTAYKR